MTGFTTSDGVPVSSIAAGAKLEVAPAFVGETEPADGADVADVADVVVSWYVTAGVLDPARTVGTEKVTLTAPEAAGPLRIIGVARQIAGGTAWGELTLEVAR